MLTYPVVNIIAFSCKITIRKTFFISQHFLFFSVRTDCYSVCTELAPAVSEIQHRKRKKVVYLADPTAESTPQVFG